MADLHRWIEPEGIELSGLSADPHLDERLKSLSLKRAKPAQSPYDIDEAEFPGTQKSLLLKRAKLAQSPYYINEDEFPGTQVGLWYKFNISQVIAKIVMKFIIGQLLMKKEILGLCTKFSQACESLQAIINYSCKESTHSVYTAYRIITWLLTHTHMHTHIDRTPIPAVRTVFDLATPKTNISLSFESMILSPLSAPPRSEPKGCRGK